MIRLNISILIFLMTIFSVNGQSAMTPEQILAKSVSVVSNSKGVEAKFSVSGSGYSGHGEIKTSGGKFTVTLPDVEVWYNGKNLYTYNKKSGETTLITPTSEELSETNPLAYITGAGKNYNVSFSTVKKPSKYVLELLPKSKNGGIKRITLTLNKANYTPEKIVMEPKNGTPLTAEINSFKSNVSLSANDFEYPKTKYPKVEIIDLR